MLDYIHIEKPKQLQYITEDLKEYKKYFPTSKMRIALDKETYWTDEEYRQMMMVYRKENKCIPPFVPTRDGGWEALPRIMALGLDPLLFNRQYLIDFKEIAFEQVTEELGDILAKECILIGHNLKYDLAPLIHMLKIVPEEVRCTMLIAQKLKTGDKFLANGEKSGFSLAALYELLIDETLFIALTGKTPKEYEKFKKVNQTSDWAAKILNPDQLQYSADDVRLIFYMYHALLSACTAFTNKYPQSGLLNMIKIESKSSLEYSDMEVRGIGADADYIKNELIPYMEYKASEARESISGTDTPEMWVQKDLERGGRTNPHTISWMEPLALGCPERGSKGCPSLQTPQLAKCIEKLGFKLTKETKSGEGLATDKEVMLELLWTSPPSRERNVLEKIIQARKASRSLSSYGYKMLDMIHSDGRYHPSAHQLGRMDDPIETGRNSFADPPMQTIPAQDKLFEELLEDIKYFTSFDDFISSEKVRLVTEGKDPNVMADAFTLFRRMVIAREGYILINADFSNEEGRVIGEMSCDAEIIRAFKNNEDLHQKTANNLGVDRNTGKLFFLSSQYGAKELKIKQTLYIKSGGKILLELADVKVLRDRHFQLYSGLSSKIAECKKYVETHLSAYDSLMEFRFRKPMLVGFTPVYGCHRYWMLTGELEKLAASLARKREEALEAGESPPVDFLHKYHKVKQKDGSYGTWNNLFNKRTAEIVREYFNFLVQAECAIVLKVALIAIGKKFRRLGYDMKTEGVILVVHDEILAEVRKEHEEEAKKIIHDCMKEALETILKQIPAEVAIGSGSNWMEAAP